MTERGGVEAYEGRAVKPEDNGNVSGAHLARDFSNKPQPYRGEEGWPGPVYTSDAADALLRPRQRVPSMTTL